MLIKVNKPEIVMKSWGREEIIHNSKDYCGKILCFQSPFSILIESSG